MGFSACTFSPASGLLYMDFCCWAFSDLLVCMLDGGWIRDPLLVEKVSIVGILQLPNEKHKKYYCSKWSAMVPTSRLWIVTPVHFT